jgi:tail tube protein
MAGELWQSVVQVGREATYGTQVAATRKMYLMEPRFQRTRPPNPRRFATGDRQNQRALTLRAIQAEGEAKMPVSSDEMLEFLECAFGAAVITTPAGATLGRLHTYKPLNTVPSMTLERHDGARTKVATGVRTAKITIEGSVEGENTATFSLFGKDYTNLGALTGALSDRLPTFMEGWETRLYIDAIGATPFTTLASSFLLDWVIEIEFAMGRKYTADNTLSLNSVILGEISVRARLGVEAVNALAATAYTDWDAETGKLVGIEFGLNEQLEASPTNEVQTLTEGTAITAGTFTLLHRGSTTSAIGTPWSAALIQAALEALPTIGAGNVSCTGGPLDTTPVTITFIGQLSGTNVPQLTSNQGGLTGTFTHATSTPGVGSKRAVQIAIPGLWDSYDMNMDNALTRKYQLGIDYIYDSVNAFGVQIGCINARTATFA